MLHKPKHLQVAKLDCGMGQQMSRCQGVSRRRRRKGKPLNAETVSCELSTSDDRQHFTGDTGSGTVSGFAFCEPLIPSGDCWSELPEQNWSAHTGLHTSLAELLASIQPQLKEFVDCAIVDLASVSLMEAKLQCYNSIDIASR